MSKVGNLVRQLKECDQDGNIKVRVKLGNDGYVDFDLDSILISQDENMKEIVTIVAVNSQ